MLHGISDEPLLCYLIGDSEDFGTVYYNEQATANILSLSMIQQKFSIDLVKNNHDFISAFTATDRENGHIYKFKQLNGGLFGYEGKMHICQSKAYVTRVRDLKKLYTKKQIQGAEKALLLRQRLSYPNIQEFKKMVIAGSLKDLDITSKDIDVMDHIFGKQYAEAAGKSVHRPTGDPPEEGIIDIAAEMVDKMKEKPLTLHGDIFFVDRIPFLLTVSKPINYVIVTYLKKRTWPEILEGLETHKNVYKSHGWDAKYLRFDREKGVSCIKNALATKLDLHLDQTAPYQKVPAAERKIRVVKERMRTEIANLGYNINRNFLIYLPKYCCRRLNITTSNIIGVNISPSEILTGQRASAKVELKVGFGEYALVHYEGADKLCNQPAVDNASVAKNSMRPRSRACVCLGISNNIAASGIFYDIGKTIKQIPLIADNFEIVPMPDAMLIKLNELAKDKPISFDEQQFTIQNRAVSTEVIAAEHQIEPSAEVNPDSYTNTTVNAEIEMPEMLEESPLRENFIEDLETNDEIEDDVDNENELNVVLTQNAEAIRQLSENTHELRGDIADGFRGDYNAQITNTADVVIMDVDNDAAVAAIANSTSVHMDVADDQNVVDTSNPLKRVTRSQNSISKKKMAFHVNKVEVSKIIHRNYRISMKKGLQLYGEEAEKSIHAEIMAMEKKKVFTPVNHQSLSYSQKIKAIRSFMFLKEKFKPDGEFDKLKSRLTANGKTQNREEVEQMFGNTSSPTISTSSLMSILAIAKSESRNLATIDVKNAYLNANLEDEGLIVILDSVVTSEYIKVRPDAANFVNDKGELYCKLNRALYGTVEGAKAWYNDLRDFLVSIGFQNNSYDNCVFNKTVKGTQITIGVYVDDLLITCKDKDMIHEFRNMLEKKYEEVSFDDGVKLSYLGMIIDNSNKNYIELSMPLYIDQVIEEMGIKDEIISTPAAAKLFDIDESSETLSDDDKEAFHTSVAKLLYLAKRARPDILLPVTFLCTRVQYSTEEDMKKLRRVLKYLNGTRNLFMKIRMNNNTANVNVFCDASFAVHNNMRSHTGAVITVGRNAVFYKCNKQKLNTKSSTEAELVALSDVLPQAVHTANFIQEQIGQEVIPTFLEDNKSTISMVKNGRALAESTRHINIRYFLISDYLEQGLIDIKYINTKDQVGDYYTKPLQGDDFTRHRDYILGHTDDEQT